MTAESTRWNKAISIHAPRTGSDADRILSNMRQIISIHAPRTGSDFSGNHLQETMYYFNPRSPHGERRAGTGTSAGTRIFQSTLPARGATAKRRYPWTELSISIHAPRTGSDPSNFALYGRLENFNPRSPHGERRHTQEVIVERVHFNPRSPHGERLFRTQFPHWSPDFNPRSPHGERRIKRRFTAHISEFQSTLPARGATYTEQARLRIWLYFNPRSPHGERRLHPQYPHLPYSRFQSTLPARGATNACTVFVTAPTYFNPRSPHGERLSRVLLPLLVKIDFNPRSPHGERLCKAANKWR